MRLRSVVWVSMLVVGCSDAHLNLPPVVADLAFDVMEDTVGTATLDATDPDRDGLLVEVETTPSHGTVEISGKTITYTPEANFHGDDALTVTVYDSKNPRETATVSITVLPVNDAPVGEADSIAATEDLPRTIAASALVQNDTDIDGDTLSLTGVAAATHGTVALSGTDVVFTPEGNFVGEGSFEYTLSDGGATATVAVTVDIGGENDAPVAANDAATTAEDTPIDVTNLLANDTDDDGQVLTVDSALEGTGGTVGVSGNTVTFTPTENFNGTATFTYVVTDGVASDTGTVTVTVTAVNDAPVAVGDSGTTNEDAAVTFTALAGNDTDVDLDTLAVSAVANPVNGSVALNGGQPIFTPSANVNGSASFNYTISDGAGGTDTATVTITINAVNDAPVALDDAANSDEDVEVVFTNLTANDTDVDVETLTITSVTNAVNCSVVLDNGDVIFTPDANFNGTATFDYTISDALGATDVGKVTVTVAPVLDIAVASVAPSTVDVLASGGTAILTVNVVEPAPAGGIAINVSSGTSDFAVPSSVTVPAGATSATFRIRADATAAAGPITITATLADGGSSKTAAATVVVAAPAPAFGDLVINEVHYDVPTVGNADTNCDAVNDTTDDEFIEIANQSAHPVQLQGVALWDATAFLGATPVFAFPMHVLGAGETVVAFAAATVGTTGTGPWCTNLDGTHIGDSRAFAANKAFNLNNTAGETVHVTVSTIDKTDLVTALSLPTTGSDQAYVRDPDFTGAFVKDGTGIGASDRNWSPGSLVTGLPFAAATP